MSKITTNNITDKTYSSIYPAYFHKGEMKHKHIYIKYKNISVPTGDLCVDTDGTTYLPKTKGQVLYCACGKLKIIKNVDNK